MTTLVQFLIALLGVFTVCSLSTYGMSFLRVKAGHDENKVWDKDFKPTFFLLFMPNLVVLITVFFII